MPIPSSHIKEIIISLSRISTGLPSANSRLSMNSRDDEVDIREARPYMLRQFRVSSIAMILVEHDR